MPAQGEKHVSFCCEGQWIEYSAAQRAQVPTKDFVQVTEKDKRHASFEPDFADPIPKGLEDDLNMFKEDWKVYMKFVRPTDISVLARFKQFRDVMSEEPELIELFEELEETKFFATFVDLYTFVDGIKTYGFPRYCRKQIRMGEWESVKEVIELFEAEWKKHANTEVEMVQCTIDFAYQNWFGKIVYDCFKAEKDSFIGEENYVEKKNIVDSVFSDRWAYFRDFFASPVEVYNEYKKKFVEAYFLIFDSCIVYSMLNNTKVDDYFVAEKLINWEIPESLLLEDSFRCFFPPIVCADRFFSCRHDQKSRDEIQLPVLSSKQDVSKYDITNFPGITCRIHPGKLLLTLIRLNLVDMVKFAIQNGIPVNISTQAGNCCRLKWNTDTMPTSRRSRTEVRGDRTGISDMEIAEANKSAAQFFSSLKLGIPTEVLESEYAAVTPISIAVENAVYGASTDIVEMLLNSNANPLCCSDAGIKACLNGLEMLTSDSQNIYKSIPYLEDMNIQMPLSGANKVVDKNAIPVLQSKVSKGRQSIHKRGSGTVRAMSKASSGSQNATKGKKTKEIRRSKRKSSIHDRKKAYENSTRLSNTRMVVNPLSVEERLSIGKRQSLPKTSALKRGSDFARGGMTIDEKIAIQKTLDARKNLKPLRHASTLRKILKPVPSTSSITSLAATQAVADTREKIALDRAKKCCSLVSKSVLGFKKIRQNHSSKIWLYQACIERRLSVIKYLLETKKSSDDAKSLKTFLQLHNETNDGQMSEVSGRTEYTQIERKVADLEAFEFMISVIDLLMNDGLQKMYPSYNTVLEPILLFIKEYDMFLNNWRFSQLFMLIKLAMHENLAGDRACIHSFLKLPQMKHFLGLVHDFSWESKRLENLPLTNNLRSKLRIEPRTIVSRRLTEFSRKSSADNVSLNTIAQMKGVMEQEISYQSSMEKVEKLLKLATRMEAVEIVAELLKSKGVHPARTTIYKIIAMSVKSQNTQLFEYLYRNFGQETLLNKAFVICLKGMFYLSMEKVFDLGFNISLKDVPRNLSEESVASRFRKPVVIGKKGKTSDAKYRQTMSLFAKCLEDVLFERTKFDRDGGRRNQEGFTRQDEENTFKLLVLFLLEKMPVKYMKKILAKILQRSIEEYDKRIWFYGFHDMLSQIVAKEKFELITDTLIEVYGLNYIQWLLYIRDLKKKFEDERRKEELKKQQEHRKSRRNWRGRSKGSSKERRESSSSRRSSETEEEAEKPKDPNSLDTEVFLTIATSKIDRSLKEILARAPEVKQIKDLEVEIERVRDLLRDVHDLERTPRELVEPNCRRNGSRNHDYLVTHTMENGASDFL